MTNAHRKFIDKYPLPYCMQIVTLTTDFGTKDYYAAALKGNLLKQSDNIQIIDISHSISTHDIVQGAFFIKNAYRHFPEGTIHVASIQSFNEDGKRLIAFEKDGYKFIGPDNGFFSLIFDDINIIKKYQIQVEDGGHNLLHDVITHAVGYLAQGKAMNELGPELDEALVKIGLRPVITKSNVRATIIHVDHFGNVIINLNKEVFQKERNGRRFLIYYKGREQIDVICDHYSDVEIGDVVCFFNSADLLEIAINMGNANEMLSLRKNETIQIDFLD